MQLKVRSELNVTLSIDLIRHTKYNKNKQNLIQFDNQLFCHQPLINSQNCTYSDSSILCYTQLRVLFSLDLQMKKFTVLTNISPFGLGQVFPNCKVVLGIVLPLLSHQVKFCQIVLLDKVQFCFGCWTRYSLSKFCCRTRSSPPNRTRSVFLCRTRYGSAISGSIID